MHASKSCWTTSASPDFRFFLSSISAGGFIENIVRHLRYIQWCWKLLIHAVHCSPSFWNSQRSLARSSVWNTCYVISYCSCRGKWRVEADAQWVKSKWRRSKARKHLTASTASAWLYMRYSPALSYTKPNLSSKSFDACCGILAANIGQHHVKDSASHKKVHALHRKPCPSGTFAGYCYRRNPHPGSGSCPSLTFRLQFGFEASASPLFVPKTATILGTLLCRRAILKSRIDMDWSFDHWLVMQVVSLPQAKCCEAASQCCQLQHHPQDEIRVFIGVPNVRKSHEQFFFVIFVHLSDQAPLRRVGTSAQTSRTNPLL